MFRQGNDLWVLQQMWEHAKPPPDCEAACSQGGAPLQQLPPWPSQLPLSSGLGAPLPLLLPAHSPVPHEGCTRHSSACSSHLHYSASTAAGCIKASQNEYTVATQLYRKMVQKGARGCIVLLTHDHLIYIICDDHSSWACATLIARALPLQHALNVAVFGTHQPIMEVSQSFGLQSLRQGVHPLT